MLRAREGAQSAEQVALYEGDAVERSRFRRLFEPIRTNWYQLLVQNIAARSSADVRLFVSIVPYLASAPKIMSGEMSIGTMMQNATSFGMVQLEPVRIAL